MQQRSRFMTNPVSLAQHIQAIIHRALDEDVGQGDVTSLWTLPADSALKGEFLVKADGVLSGLEVAAGVFAMVDHRIQFSPLASDGERVSAGDIIGRVSGPGVSILTAERTVLNFLQRMSGIATLTRRYVDAVAGTRAIILDTRKTAPGLRALDKLAVRAGGGYNHRFGLFDMVLIKDNHIAGAGGITRAVAGVRANNHGDLAVEVEVKSLEELREALAIHPPLDRIMLDNMPPAVMRQAVEETADRVSLEASGGVNLQTVAEIAATGVDFISVGALTHSVMALDISLDIV
jgi:nicotinate-nucleotide pyrophosphorylase (carboxylating)